MLNAAARFIAGTAARIHVSDIMRSLHWLQIAHRIRFKLCPHAGREQRNQSNLPVRHNLCTTPISSMTGHRRQRFAMTNVVRRPMHNDRI